MDDKEISLNLFVAYDLTYNKTNVRDYTNIRPDLAEQLDSAQFIGAKDITEETERLVHNNVLNDEEARRIFGKGYAGQRNAISYFAIKQGMDYLIFLDDDEYPVAVTKTRKTAIWGGQSVLTEHLKHIAQADITNGYHCGYISPIPYIKFNETLPEEHFRFFIEAISNDVINWDSIKATMERGGVTYADTDILTSEIAVEVPETNHAKFITGANLCINLTNPSRVFPFYNPPGARGEDTFLSTLLTDRKVLRIPCYAFHDGFSTYKNILEGVLPIQLKFISADDEHVVNRFYKACIGWIRYKPLLLFITQRDEYDQKIMEMREQLIKTLPEICAYFDEPKFMNILKELDKYDKNAKKHYHEFAETQKNWAKIMEHFS
ncbi:hypothetical protein [Trichococcus palustris]|uniref:hypothetical protein n=1 Tax=Trichococcus palustris TaxID=140314 RepID=UPI001C4ECBEA|nr:hypothetical protein [Trichococcus palustris]